MTLKVPQWLLNEMHGHVAAHYPEEACGAVLHAKRPAERYYGHKRMQNVAKNPRVEYAWDAGEHRELYDMAETQSAELWLVYHSHPETAPEPSVVDLAASWHVGVHYLIFSLAGGAEDVWYQSYLCTEPGHLVLEEVEVL